MGTHSEPLLSNSVVDHHALERYFTTFRHGIIGQNQLISTAQQKAVKLIYADWTASGRMYLPIERRLLQEMHPYIANTHTETNYTGSKMTIAYKAAKKIIKAHVGADENDILIASGAGMTAVVNKLQRILGLKIHEKYEDQLKFSDQSKPVVFISHMEHHSNQTSWNETIADVVVVPPDDRGLVSVENFRQAIENYKDRQTKIAAITACSNVTGIVTPYMDIAALIHEYDGTCFVDFACSAPYVNIDMHVDNASSRYLDAVYFSPHKFLGGPGSSGILVFNKNLYKIKVPDHPGGGTVDWTNPWGEQKYCDDIEAREDGGTPAFIQTIKAAMCIKLKEEMGVDNMLMREKEQLGILWQTLGAVPNLHILGADHRDRLGIISFYIEDLNYNLGVKILNDRFGIQTRGGCSCAGTYGHFLLNVSKPQSKQITNNIDRGDQSTKPGWIRLSIHPTQSTKEIQFIGEAIKSLAKNHEEWAKEYEIDLCAATIRNKKFDDLSFIKKQVMLCFEESFSSSKVKMDYF